MCVRIEWDAFTNTTRTVETFPCPAQLWERWQRNTGLDAPPLRPGLPVAPDELRPLYDADGQFRFDGLPVGEVTMCWPKC